jgi:hypothetical protein
MRTVPLVRADELGTEPGEACVGILWLVTHRPDEHNLIISRTPLSRAETYGECLTDPRGHAELWAAWIQADRQLLARLRLPTTVALTEYDDHPRGRVVHHLPTQEFWVFLDPRLRCSDIIHQVVRTFGIQDSTTRIRSDDHYRARSVT